MIGITANQFIHNEFNWSPEKLALCFMACYLRPLADPGTIHAELRQINSRYWFDYMGHTPPTPPTPTTKRKKYNFLLFNRRKRLNNFYF